jgi:hypothetical protein
MTVNFSNRTWPDMIHRQEFWSDFVTMDWFCKLDDGDRPISPKRRLGVTSNK